MDATIRKLLQTIEDSIAGFTEGLSHIQEQTYKKLIELAKSLDVYASGNLKSNFNNVKLIGKLKGELETIILNDKYIDHVAEFAKTFDTVKQLNNEYFSKIAVEFREKKVFEQVTKNAVLSTVEHLTESGIQSGYIDAVENILSTNINSGGSYADLTKQLSDYVRGGKDSDGGLVDYARKEATDSISGFNATYNRVVSDDLGLTFFQYTGSLLTTSRPFCVAMVNKRYFHISEVDEMLKGHIGDVNVSLNEKTGLPNGMIAGTNKDTFFINRGGHFCQHQIFPVPLVDVPEELRAKFE